MTRRHRGMTMLEVLMAITVLGVVSAAILPVIEGAADGYASASTARKTSGRIAYAMERCIRLLREAPGSTLQGSVAISLAEEHRIRFDDGRGLALIDGTLWMINEEDTQAPLLREVDGFEITYLGDDGATDTMDDPSETQRFVIAITSGGMTVRGIALPRVRAIPPEEAP